MLNKFYLLLLISMLVLTSCEDKYSFTFDSPKKISVNQPLTIAVSEKNNKKIDKITYYLDGKRLENHAKMDISNQRLGKHVLKAVVAYNSKTKNLTNTIIFLASKEPVVYTYKVINTYPHDSGAYTQGLEFHEGFLYESTGRKGQSSLRKVDLETGKVLQKVDVNSKYFAEGMTIYKDKIYQLTWQSKLGFVYDLKDFKQRNTFHYNQSKEGWGLTHDGTKLIKTDGTEKVWFLNPDTLEEIGYIEAYTNKQRVKDLNELEYVEGKIYANVWQKNIILILNHNNGAIEGIIDLSNLEKEVKKSQRLEPNDDVLNGIAYDDKTKRLFVTGKHWNSLFEIKIFKRD